MTIEQTEINQLLQDFHENFLKVFLSQDIDKILDFHHQDAVLVHFGKVAIYGREGIRKFYEKLLKEHPEPYKIIPIKNMATSDGEYLIQEGILDCIVDGEPKKFPVVTILKKDKDGKYKYYRDEVKEP
uniref:SnoaL-like domain-containing protein n=1 Tax=Acrobeloides nanus TaxID=290746 RepID=A0A914EFZ4_9BILA